MLASDAKQWSLDELTAQVALLMANDGPRQVSGRVNDVPDQRTIRYYTTKGLLSPPLSFRGRSALYGERHLWQLLAIKRLQARGMSLVDIQQRLLGASDVQLAELAGLTVAPKTTVTSPVQALTSTEEGLEGHFWKAASTTSANQATTQHPSTLPSVQVRTTLSLAPGIDLTIIGNLDLDDYDVAALRGAAAPLLKLLTHQFLPHLSRNSVSTSTSATEEMPCP